MKLHGKSNSNSKNNASGLNINNDTPQTRIYKQNLAITFGTNTGNKIVGMLLDLNMPNVNGFEVLEFFRNNNLFVKIPVSIITGDDSRETIDRAFTYPITDVLEKPFNERDIKRILDKMISLHQAI